MTTILLALFTFCSVAADSDIVVSLARHFGSHHILIVNDDGALNSATSFRMEKFLMKSDYLFVTVVTWKQVPKILERRQTSKILAILNSDDFVSPEPFVELARTANFSSLTWTVLTSKTNEDFFKDVRIPFDCKFAVAEGNRSSGYAINEIYGITAKKFYISKKGIESQFRFSKNLRSEIVTVSSAGKDACKLSYEYRGIKSVVQCIHCRMWSFVAEALNFTFIYAGDPQYEIPFLNRVKLYGVEISFHNLVLSAPLLNDYSFSWPTWKDGLDIYTAYREQTFEWRTFIRPFQVEIWACVAGSIAILTAVALSVDRLLPEDRTLDSAFIPLMAFCNQGVPDPPKKLNHRILFVLSFAVPTFLVPAYSAVLTSFLTVHVLRMPFSDLDGLATAKNYKLGYIPPFDFAYFLKQDPSPTARKLLETTLCPPSDIPKTGKEGAERMCKGKFSLVNVFASMLTIKPSCRYYKLDKPYLLVHAGMPIRKGSPYKSFIDRCLRTIRFSGLLEAVKDREAGYIFKMKEMPESEKESSVTFENTVLLFSLISSGIFASLFVFYWEIALKRKKE